MLRAALRNVLAHKLRLGLTAVAIVLAVAFVAGTYIFTDSLGNALDRLIQQTQPDVIVEAASADFSAELHGSGRTLTVPAGLAADIAGLRGVSASLPQVQVPGVVVLDRDGKPFPRSGDIARIWLPAGANGPAFALLQNFYAVRSYNPSNKYALAICHLSDKIRGDGAFIHPWPTQERLLTLAETQEMQEKLTAMGFDTGVYLVVFGGVMLILSMMGTVKPSRTRSARHGEIDIHRRSARTGEMH